MNYCKKNQNKWEVLRWGDILPPPKKYEEIINSEVEKRNYEKTINVCKKLQSLIQKVIVRNTAIISKNEYDNIRI